MLTWDKACRELVTVTSHLQRNTSAIQEQEIATKYLNTNKRAGGVLGIQKCNRKCRLCHISVKDITRVISSCPEFSSIYYVSMRRDMIAKTIQYHSEKRKRKHCPEINIKNSSVIQVQKYQHKEYWWTNPIKTSVKCKCNVSDTVVRKRCALLHVSGALLAWLYL